MESVVKKAADVCEVTLDPVQYITNDYTWSFQCAAKELEYLTDIPLSREHGKLLFEVRAAAPELLQFRYCSTDPIPDKVTVESLVALVEDIAQVTITPIKHKPGDSSWVFECRADQISDLEVHASKLTIKRIALKLELPSGATSSLPTPVHMPQQSVPVTSAANGGGSSLVPISAPVTPQVVYQPRPVEESPVPAIQVKQTSESVQRFLAKESVVLRSVKEFFDQGMAAIKKDDRDFVECHMNCLFLHFNHEYRCMNHVCVNSDVLLLIYLLTENLKVSLLN